MRSSRYYKAHLLLLAFLTAAAAFFAAAPALLNAAESPARLELRVSPAQIHQGQSAKLTVSVSNVDLDAPPSMEALEERFVVSTLAPSKRSEIRMMQDGAGVRRFENRTVDYNYLITPKGTGTFTIEPPQIPYEGSFLSAEAVQLDVLEPTKTDLVLLETSVSPSDSVYPLVPFEVSVDVFIKAYPEEYSKYDPLSLIVHNIGAPALTIPWLDSRELNNLVVADPLEDWLGALVSTEFGFSLNQYRLSRSPFDFDFSFFGDSRRQTFFLPRPVQVERPDANGVNVQYWKYSFKRKMRASSPATLTLQPTTIDGAFLDFADAGKPVSASIFLSSDPITLRIKEIPEEDAPDNYVGVYGNIQQKASISTSNASVGDAITLSLEYTGYGSFNAASAPDIANLTGIKDVFRVYPASERSVDSGVAFDYKLRPLKEGKWTVPNIKTSFFNVEKGKFETMDSTVGEINVAAGVLNPEEEDAFGDDETNGSSEKSSEIDGVLQRKQKQFQTAALGVVGVIAALAILVGLFFLLRSAVRANARRIASSNRRIIDAARSALEEGIIRLDSDPYEGFSQIRLAFLQLVSRRLPHSIDAHTDAEILAFIDREFAKDVARNEEAAATIKSLKEFFLKAEEFRFGGASSFNASAKTELRELFTRWTTLLLLRSKKLSVLAQDASRTARG